MRFLAHAMITSLVVLFATACGGGGYGDFVLRVWFESYSVSGDCAVTGTRTDTIMDVATIFVFQGNDGDYFAELTDAEGDGAVLAGEKDGSEYEFAGTESVTTTSGTMTLTDSQGMNVAWEMDGDNAQGSYVLTDSSLCAGTGCPTNATCTGTAEFSGVKVDDVDLEHGV